MIFHLLILYLNKSRLYHNLWHFNCIRSNNLIVTEKMKIEPLLAIDSNNLIAKENNVIKVSKGPQFKTKGGTILAMIFLLFLSVAFLYQAEFLVALICFFISVIIFSLALDIHGMELDTSNHKIRDYTAFLWFKIGEWSNINEFPSIYLTQKNVTIRTSGYSGGSADTYHYYHIKLVD